MTTLGTMITEIEGHLGRTDLSAANGPIQKSIEAAVRFLQPISFYFNDNDETTFSTVAAQEEYDDDDTSGSPEMSEWYRMDAVFLEESSGQRHELDLMPYAQIKTMTDTTDSSSRPTHYCRYKNKMYLYPQPDAVYTIRLAGHYKYAFPAASGTTDNAWFTEAYDCVMCYAKAHLYTHRIKNPDMAQAMYQVAEIEKAKLISATSKKEATNRLESTQF